MAIVRESDLAAATFVGGMWAAVRMSDGPRHLPSGYRHFPGLFRADFLASLMLPGDMDYPLAREVTLEGTANLERRGLNDLADAYKEKPRTRIYENIASPWALAARWHFRDLAGVRLVSHSTSQLPMMIILADTTTNGIWLQCK